MAPIRKMASYPQNNSNKAEIQMTKTLIIAEKPSVANDIAKTLGGFTKYEDYFESFH